MGGRGASSAGQGTGGAKTAPAVDTSPENLARLSKNADELEKDSSRLLKTLNDDDVYAVEEYTGTLYSRINNGLRNGDLSEFDQKKSNRIDAVMEKSVLKQDIAVYRGLNVSQLNEMFDNGSIVGTVIKDKGFKSTSRKKDMADAFHDGKGISMQIIVPKGTNAVGVRSISRHKKEDEVILDRKLSFRIVSASTDSKGRRNVVAVAE